jgi:type IV pilus modification protein PilV
MGRTEGNVMRTVSCQGSQQGFTILEVLIAMFILAFGLLAIASMQTTAIKGNSQAMGLTEAVNLAQYQMETLIARPYTDPLLTDTNGNGTGHDADRDGVDDTSGQDFGLDDTVDGTGTVIADQNWTDPSGVYTLYWNVAVDEPIQNVKRIRLIVRWTERGFTRTATFDFTKSQVI